MAPNRAPQLAKSFRERKASRLAGKRQRRLLSQFRDEKNSSSAPSSSLSRPGVFSAGIQGIGPQIRSPGLLFTMASTSNAKLVVFALDILCTLLALVLISFGVYVLVSYNLNQIGALAAYGYVGLGVAALLVVLWGYLSAWRENVCCTVTFIVFLCLVIIAQFATVYLLFTQDKSVATNLASALDLSWEEELNSPGAMSLYQNWFQCCGRGSPQDYIVNERLPPVTCFRDHDKSKPENLIHTGCRVEFENYWLKLTNIFNIIGFVLIGLELLLSVASCRLCNSIRNDARRSYF